MVRTDVMYVTLSEIHVRVYRKQDYRSIEGKPPANNTPKHGFCSHDFDLDQMT